MSTQEIIRELAKLNRDELIQVDLRLHATKVQMPQAAIRMAIRVFIMTRLAAAPFR